VSRVYVRLEATVWKEKRADKEGKCSDSQPAWPMVYDFDGKPACPPRAPGCGRSRSSLPTLKKARRSGARVASWLTSWESVIGM